MNRYELIYIIDTGLEEAARKELVEKVSTLITANGGEIEKVDETWGKRHLAYAINYKTEGWYVLVNFKAEPDLPREIERNLRINENVLRYLVIKLEEKRSQVKPRAARPAAVEAPAEVKAEEAVEEVAEEVTEAAAEEVTETVAEAAEEATEAVAEAAE